MKKLNKKKELEKLNKDIEYLKEKIIILQGKYEMLHDNVSWCTKCGIFCFIPSMHKVILKSYDYETRRYKETCKYYCKHHKQNYDRIEIDEFGDKTIYKKTD